MPAYRIPDDAQVLDALRRATATKRVVDSQRKLKRLVDKEMRGDETFLVGEERLRRIAIASDLFEIRILTRESDAKKTLRKCPVCGSRVRRVRNMTVFGGTVTLGFRCGTCGYSSGLRRQVPTRYVFTRK